MNILKYNFFNYFDSIVLTFDKISLRQVQLQAALFCDDDEPDVTRALVCYVHYSFWTQIEITQNFA